MFAIGSRCRAVLAVAAASVLLLAVSSGTASAHGDEGELTLTRVEQTAPLAVTVEVGIVYESDDHLAEAATVQATLTGPDGAQVGPTTLVRSGDTTSLYSASIPVPAAGDWNVDVESTEPEGTVAGSVTVTSEANTVPPTAEAPLDTTAAAPTDGAVGDAPTAISPTAASDVVGDGGSNTALVAGLAVVAVVVLGGGSALALRRRGRDAPADNN